MAIRRSRVIDIGSSKVACLEASASFGGGFDVGGYEVCEYEGYSLGALPSLSTLTEALDRVLAPFSSGLMDGRSRSVYVGVPAPFVHTVVTHEETFPSSRTGRISEADVSELFEQAVSELDPIEGFDLMHSLPFSFAVNGVRCAASPVGLEADRLSASFCHEYVDKGFASLVTSALERLGVRSVTFVSTELACAEFMIPFRSRIDGAIMIDCGGTHTDISMLRGGAIANSRTIGIGGRHITSDISYVLDIPFDPAEELKRRYSFGLDYAVGADPIRPPACPGKLVDPAELQQIVESRAEELASLISEVLDEFFDQLPPHAPIYLFGGGIAEMRGGVDYLSARLDRKLIVNAPKTGLLKSVRYAPALALAHFILNGGAEASVAASPTPSFFARIVSLFRELFARNRA